MSSTRSFAEVDISEWTPEGIEPLGTKPKMWLIDPSTEEMWLFKTTTSNTRADGSVYLKGDDWAERIATEVGARLGLPVASTELAFVDMGDDRSLGIISRKVLADSESLIHGNELLADVGVVGETTRDRTGYTLDAVRLALEQVAPPKGGEPFTAWEWFVGYLVLDALIANTDRHQENWAVIENGGRRLAPTFDHASSLGFLLDDAHRELRMETIDVNRTVAAYAQRAKSKFEGSPHPCDVAHVALGMVREEVGQHWLHRAGSIPSLQPIVDRIPDHRMSDASRRFAVEVFAANRARTLLHPPYTVES